jgi:hypothetical protein
MAATAAAAAAKGAFKTRDLLVSNLSLDDGKLVPELLLLRSQSLST